MTESPTLAQGIAVLDRSFGAAKIAEALRVPEACVQSVLDDPAHHFASQPLEKFRTMPVDLDGLDQALVFYVDQQYRAHQAAVGLDVMRELRPVMAEVKAARVMLRLLDTWIQGQGGNMKDDWLRIKRQAAEEERGG